MRLSLGLEVVQSGGEPIGEPLYWPVYFTVDDPALRFLAGDVAAADWLQGPGPLGKGEVPAWIREVPVSGIAGPAYFGFGLLYSDGGAADEATQAAYEELLTVVHTLALDHVAQASGLGVMLGAFGSAAFQAKGGKDGASDLDRLREGIDPEELAKEIDGDLLHGLGGFREVGASLLPFTPGAATPASFGRKPTANIAAAMRAARRPALEAGRVLAVTVQAFRADEIAAKGRLEIHRELPVRGDARVALKLDGRVAREELK